MERTKKLKEIILLVMDILSINLAFLFAFIVRYDFDFPEEYIEIYLKQLPIILFIYFIFLYTFRMYKILWGNASIDEFIKGVFACTISGFAINLLNLSYEGSLPSSIVILSTSLITLIMVGSRLSYRIYGRLSIYENTKARGNGKKILIVGAGSCAHLVIDEIYKSKEINMIPVGIVDDDKNKIGTYLMGVEVLGTIKSIPRIVKELNIDTIIFAISNIEASNKKRYLRYVKCLKQI